MLRTARIALLTAVLSSAASMTALAQDQETGEIVVDPSARSAAPAAQKKSLIEPGPLRFYGGFSIAVRGEVWTEEEDSGNESASNLDPTIGLQGGVDYVVMKYFSIGGEMRFLWPKADEQVGRDFLWDIDVKPRGRFPLAKIPLELYAAMPIGLTVPGLDGSQREGTVGFNVGLLAGANWFFTENFGINAEMGWVFHKFGAEDPGDDYDVSMNQFQLLCPNFIYAL